MRGKDKEVEIGTLYRIKDGENVYDFKVISVKGKKALIEDSIWKQHGIDISVIVDGLKDGRIKKLSEEERKALSEEFDFSEYQAEGFKDEKEAHKWYDLGISPKDARDYRVQGYTPESYERMRGRTEVTGGGLGLGGTDICVCPECGHEESHEKGTPCSKYICPVCAHDRGLTIHLVGKGMPHGKGKGVFKKTEQVDIDKIVSMFMNGDDTAGLIKDAAVEIGSKGISSSYEILGMMNMLIEEPEWKILCRRRDVMFGESISMKYQSIYESEEEDRRDEVTGDLSEISSKLKILFEKAKVNVDNFKDKKLLMFLSDGDTEEDIKIFDSFLESLSCILSRFEKIVEESKKYRIGDLAILCDKMVEILGDYKKGSEIIFDTIGSSVKE